MIPPLLVFLSEKPMNTTFTLPGDLRELALASAQSAADATAEMLRFAREGETARGTAFDDQTLPNLADALATIALIEIEHATLPGDKAALNQLAGACRKFQMDFSR